MEPSEKLTPALKRAQEEGIDLTLLYERLALTPTERIERHLQALGVRERMKKPQSKTSCWQKD
jgi:hypothetical protein